jgi:hypothetical protein
MGHEWARLEQGIVFPVLTSQVVKMTDILNSFNLYIIEMAYFTCYSVTSI